MSASDPARFAAARRLFLAAGERAGEERTHFLARECAGDAELLAEVRALLAEEDALDPRLEQPAVASLVCAGVGAHPERIGEFRILRVLGMGGMGVVYEAEQPNPRRRVALKVLRSPFASEEERTRFEHEARALAWLNHPGIATIHAAGTADTGSGPQPYLAMELVRGVRLDEHAARARLDTRARLELLARLADAVHHAHQKGVIHRDLKPGNVLVDEHGQPKILDFGVARVSDPELEATTRHTSAGQLLGTLAYMSPEQVRADPAEIDVRSDVYALGVMAYELLSGKRPLDTRALALPDAIRAIAHDEPTTLGAHDRRLRGDVETIVHKALAKEKERRYGSAAELAADLRRYLASEPILARPASRSYQLRKFARRNRALVGGVAGAFVVLAVGAVTSTLLFLEKEEQRAAATTRGVELSAALADAQVNLQRAQSAERDAEAESERARFEAETAKAVTDYLVTLFEHANPEQAGGAAVTALELLDRGVERIRDQFHDRPALRARLLNVFGKIDNWLQRYERSGPILAEALALTAEVYGEDSAEYADTLERLAWSRLERAEVREAVEMQRRVLELRAKHLGREHPLYADALNNLANGLRSSGMPAEAVALLEEARGLYLAREGGGSEALATVDYNLGALHFELGRFEDGAARLESAFATLHATLGEDHWRTLFCRATLAECLRSSGLPGASGAALEHATLAYQGLERLFGPENPMVSRALCAYASSLRDAGDPARALPILEELLARHDERGGSAADRAHLLLVLASTLHDDGQPEDAEALYLEAIESYERLGAGAGDLGAFHRDFMATARHNLSVLLVDLGRLEEALELELGVLAERERVLGLGHPNSRGSLNNLARIYADLGRPADEEHTRRQKLTALLEREGPDHWATRAARAELAAFLGAHDRPEEAAALLQGD